MPYIDFMKNKFTLVYMKTLLRFEITKMFGFCENHVIWYCEISKGGMIWGTSRKTNFGFLRIFYFSLCWKVLK